MMIYALEHAVADLSEVDSNGSTDDLNLAEAPEILNRDDTNNCNHTNSWVFDNETDETSGSGRSPSTSSSGQSTSSSSSFNGSLSSSGQSTRSSSSLNGSPTLNTTDHTFNNDPATLDNSDETPQLWRGNDVGPEAKKLLQAIDHRYPATFQSIQIRSKPIRLSILKEFHLFIKRFLKTSVDELAEDRLTTLKDDLNEFETFGFDLSWAHERVDMVEKLKFKKDPLREGLRDLDESLERLKEKLVEREKAVMEANEMLEKVWLEYDSAKETRNNKAREVARKFGDEYDCVLKGELGFGMLPGY